MGLSGSVADKRHMADLKPVLKSTRGLSTVNDPVRIGGQIPYLAEAYNVDIDDTGRISRCKGYGLTARTEDSHSIFTDGAACLFIYGTVLYQLNPDYSRTSIRTGLTSGAIMYYAAIDGKIYYSNGYESGIYALGASSGWTAAAYVGPETTKTFISPPAMKHLELWNGRIYGAVGKLLLFTEELAYSWWNQAANAIPFDADIRMIKGVKGGLFVGTSAGTIFLQGTGPHDFIYIPVDADKVLEHSAVKIDGSELGEPGEVVFWCNSKGIVQASATGTIKLISEERLTFPSLEVAHGVYVQGRYIVCIDRQLTGYLCVRLNPKYQFNDRTGRTGALSQQAGFNFTSAVFWNGVWLGAGTPGICTLESGSLYGAAAISAYFKTHLTDFGNYRDKHVRKMIMAGEGNGGMLLTYYAGESTTTLSEAFTFAGNLESNVKVKGSKSLKARFWSFKIENVAGSDFSIDEIEALVITN